MPNEQPQQPVAVRDRILALDALRGFAMMGVLIAYCMWSLGSAPEAAWSPLDTRVDTIAGFLVDGKFYTILATLFGLGFAIQLGRASDDRAAVEIYCRRLAVLAGIGLIHALLLRNGDILLPYALTGFLLIPFRRKSDRVLLVSAFAVLCFSVAIRAFWTTLGLPSLERPQIENGPYFVENAEWVRFWYRTALFSWPMNLTMFLLGLYAGRRHLITKFAGRPLRLVAIAAAGLACGTALHFARIALIEPLGSSALAGSFRWLLFTFHCWAMSSAYVALLLLALRLKRGVVLLTPLAAVGRLALSNYLLQAGLVVPLCLAFGWFDRLTPTGLLSLAAGVFLLVQMPFSLFWSRRFQFGPAEWVWRLLTYQKVPPLRVSPAEVPAL